MKLLILTQKVDKNDPILGFFHRWIEEFAEHYDKLIVICLEEGDYSLPDNVRILSLGKEQGLSKLGYISRFYKYTWGQRKNYDSVFVHMNQEYVLLGAILWKLLGKRIHLWRNHKKGGFFTSLAVILSNSVYCTSPDSFTARFKKTKLMPAGIDTEFFKPDPTIERKPNTVLFLGRIAPVKKVLEFIDWLSERPSLYATIAGGASPRDHDYLEAVMKRIDEYGMRERIRSIGSVNQDEALKLYREHELYVNLTPSGSLDKTILEAAACGTKVVVINEYLKNLESMSPQESRDFVVKNHSLSRLVIMLNKDI